MTSTRHDKPARRSPYARQTGLVSARAPHHRAAGFTLVEMLVVAALIAVLSALTLPALRGLVGASGARGAVGSVLGTLEQARNAAIETGTDVYVGFPPSGFEDDTVSRSSLIVVRGPRPATDPEDDSYLPLSRWIKLPQGVVVDASGANLIAPPDLSEGDLPLLNNQSVGVEAIRIDRFGRIRNGLNGDDLKIVLGEGVVNKGQITWMGQDAKRTLVAQRLTGRWLPEESLQ
jgi:prepilin-type N-terminal cleavage/methylation domain-containing protein